MTESVGEGKVCTGCELLKPLDAYPPDKRRRDGRGAKCRLCTDTLREAYYAKYPEKEAERRLNNAVHGQRWYQDNRENQLERMRWNATKRKYGIDKDTYYELLAKQDGRCAICQSEDAGRKDGYFSVEHCHRTGVIRGLTCHHCNVGLGMFKDSPALLRAAINYLEGSIDNV